MLHYRFLTLTRKILNRLIRFHIWLELNELRAGLASVGKNVEIVYPFDIRGKEFITIGNDVFIGPRVLMGAAKGAEILIEDAVMFGPEVKLIGGDHRYDLPDKFIKDSGVGKQGPIVIGKGAWLGAASIVLKGITIGEGAIIGAGSVVTKDIPPNQIWAGNPARFIKMRF